nr:zinc finger, CCHC-type [Tanacetum cinerariifolium]
MENENHIRTLGDYSKPSHEGYRNTIELPEGNNVVPLRSDTIRLVQNGCAFHELRSEDPNQHLKDFLKLVDSLDLDVANRERTSISTWEDLTTRFLAQFFPPGRTTKLQNNILIFQKHQEDEPEEEEIMKPNATKDDDRNIAVAVEEEVKEENTTSVIDHYLEGMILGKPFVKETRIVYDKDERTITFEKDKEKTTFKMPYKKERFKHIDKDILKTNNIPPFIITGDDGDQEKTH